MADTNIATGDAVAVKRFNDMAFQEYIGLLRFKQYMGMDANAVIHVNEQLTKEKGDAITFNLRARLSGSGVTGSTTLEGNEEAMANYGHQVVVDQVRHGVRIPLMSRKRTSYDLKIEAKSGLADWMAEKVEDDIIAAHHSVNGTAYGAATETQKDQWSDDNEDRILYGDAVANTDGSGGLGTGGNDNSDSLGAIDGTNDILDTDQISLAKRLAQQADPKIRPIKIEGGYEFYVLFAHTLCTRDLKATAAWQQAQREGMPRGVNNPIFTGAIGMWDGVIVVETERMPILAGVGAGSINVAHNALCGAQAFLFAQAGTVGEQQVEIIQEDFDYKEDAGFAIRSVYGIEKALFNNAGQTNAKQHGIVSVFSAAVAD
ncbi:MAG: N4-gp56 family major capsid protein [Mangrovimonas sp.]|nr:N4-gp56 family major capsid protein [Mangrovimonas sp.]